MNNNNKHQQQQTQSNVNILKYIYDEEFIGLINSLSNSIKDYNKNTRHFLNNINLNTSSLNEQTLFAKSALNDIMLYLNQTIKLKLNPKTNDKYFRDKLALINERLDRITELRNNITFDFSNTQKALNDFYEYAKEIFRKMRVVRNQKIEEINSKINFDNYINKANASDAGNIGDNNNSMIVKKNEKLISEIAVIKFKYDEIVKENEKLKGMLKHTNSSNTSSIINANNVSSNTTTTTTANSIRKRNLSLGITRNVPKMNTVHNSVNTSIMNSSSSTPKHNTLLYSSYNTITNSSDTKNLNKKQVKGVSITSIKKSFNIDHDNTKHRNSSASSSLSSSMNKAISNKKQRYNRNPQRNNTNNINTIPISNSTCSGNSGNNMLTVSTQSNHSASELIQGTTTTTTTIPTTINLNTNSNKTMNTTTNNNKTALNTSSNSNNNSFCNHVTPISTTNTTTNTSLANLVISFLTQMKTLQDSISSKATNVKEMKRSFELKKKELKKSAETILGISTSITTSSQLITMANNSLNNSPRDKKTYNNMSTSTNSLFTSNETNVNVVSNLNKEITELKAELIVKEEKLKNEKTISKVCEETLTNEKIKNKTLNDEISTLQHTNETLLNEVSSLKTEISKLKTTITECNSNIITISNTNESIINEKEIQIMNLNKENRELKNKIAQIKNDFITHHDEEMEILKLKLIEINNDAATSLLQIQSSQQLNDTSVTLKEIHSSTNDYINTIELIKQYREDIEKVNSLIEKRIINNNSSNINTPALSSNRNNNYIVSSSNRNNNNNNPNKTLSNINEQNSNFIDDELSSVSGIFLEEKKETVTDRKNDQHQIITNNNVDQHCCSNIGNFDMQLQNNIKLMEDNEMLLRNQLELLKIEIKKTREERDELKKQIQHNSNNNENSCCFLKGPENEIMLKQTFEKLVECLQVTGKAKEYIIMMLRLMTYSEDDIQRVINKKDKKKFG